MFAIDPFPLGGETARLAGCRLPAATQKLLVEVDTAYNRLRYCQPWKDKLSWDQASSFHHVADVAQWDMSNLPATMDAELHEVPVLALSLHYRKDLLLYLCITTYKGTGAAFRMPSLRAAPRRGLLREALPSHVVLWLESWHVLVLTSGLRKINKALAGLAVRHQVGRAVVVVVGIVESRSESRLL